MGLIGMAFGLGFIFGPAISGVALEIWRRRRRPAGRPPPFARRIFSSRYFILPKAGNPIPRPSRNRPRFAQWGHTLSQPKIGLLILIFFLATFAFSCFESTLPLLVNDNFNLGLTVDDANPVTTVIWLFVFCG